MAQGYHDFIAGEQLTAANLEDYCMRQAVMVFATAAARNSALSAVLAEGMVAFLLDSNTLTVYSGAAWSTIGPVHGALIGWTPAVTQSGGVTVTVNRAYYQRLGRMVYAGLQLTVTGSGTGSNAVTITTPVTAANATFATGVGQIQDNSAGLWYSGVVHLLSTNAIVLHSTAGNFSNPALGVNGFTAALASADVLTATFSFEAAADG